MGQPEQVGFAAGHPDANLLSAFAENALTRREREGVAAHLAECGSCRECLALAFGNAPAPSAPATGVRSRLAVWWGVAATAAACSVAGLVWFLHEPSAPPRQEVAQIAPLSRPAAPSPSGTASAVTLQDHKQVRQAPPRPPAVAAREDAPRAAAPEPQAAPPPPLRDEAPATDALKKAEENQVAVTAAAPAVPPPPPESIAPPKPEHAADEARAKRAFRRTDGATLGGVPGGQPADAPRVLTQSVEVTAVPAAVWTISANGMVERSIDNGATWQAMSIDPATTFRAVASSDQEVWAGGSAGSLFHSTDAGANWRRVPVSTPEAAATGAITSIDISRPPATGVTTSTGERWTTTDAGHSWKRN